MKRFTDEEISDLKVGILILVFGNIIVDLLRIAVQLIF